MAGEKRTKIGLAAIILLCATMSFYGVSFAQDQYSLRPDFSYDKSELIENYFFPPEKAKWDGYEVLNSDWKFLDDYQKNKFVSEASKEIENKETVEVAYEGTASELLSLLDKTNQILALSGAKQPVIIILLKSLYATGNIKGEIVTFAPNHPFLSKQILSESDKENPSVEIGKTYVGYICCYKKGDEWLPDSEGPVIGEIKRRLFFEKRIMTPSGSTALTRNYSLNFEYKIIAFRQINSFIDDYGIGIYYYKVIFEPIRNIYETN